MAVKSQTTQTRQYIDGMPHARDTLARNLRIVLKHKGWSTHRLAEEARKKGHRLSQKAVSSILRGEQAVTLDRLEAISEGLGVTISLLTQEDLPADLAVTPSLSKLYKSYIVASPEGRRMIETVAEREAEYSHKKSS